MIVLRIWKTTRPEPIALRFHSEDTAKGVQAAIMRYYTDKSSGEVLTFSDDFGVTWSGIGRDIDDTTVTRE